MSRFILPVRSLAIMDGLVTAWGKETEAVAHTKEALDALVDARYSAQLAIGALTQQIAEAYDRITALTQERSLLTEPPAFVQALYKAKKAVIAAANIKKGKYKEWKDGARLDDVPKLDYDRPRYGLGVNLVNMMMMRTATIMSLDTDAKTREALLALKLKNQNGWKRGGINRTRVTKYLKARCVWESLVAHFGSVDLVVEFLGLRK